MDRPVFNVGDVLTGSYMLGYWPRYKYFRVKGHTKSGAPRVVELKKNLISESSTPADSTKVHTLDPTLVEIGELLPTRWSAKNGDYGVSIPLFDFQPNEKVRASLIPYIPGSSFTEDSYS